MGNATIVLAIVLFTFVCGCSQQSGSAANETNGRPKTEAAPSVATTSEPQKKQPTKADTGPTENKSESEFNYTPPTAEELAPMRADYAAELAKIDEPPEMAKKSMRVPTPLSPAMLKALKAFFSLDFAHKESPSQRATAFDNALEAVKNKELDDRSARTMIYRALASLACTDGADPQTVIEYASNVIGDEDEVDEALALRARMYLKAGKSGNALGDLEKIMVDSNGHALADGDDNPRKESTSCGWSIADFDALGDDPRALAAKGLYLSSFIARGAEEKRTVKEVDIRDLYKRSARSWRSPIPHYLASTLYGYGSEHYMAGLKCIRANGPGRPPEIESACAKFDEGTKQQIRELTMALVIDPAFVPALAERADKYLRLALDSYDEGRPSRTLFKLAVDDYNAALAAGGKGKSILYYDRAMAQASLGMYQEAALGYEQGMKYAQGGIEKSFLMYTQLAGVYMKLGRFNEAADTITQAIMNDASYNGMDVVIFNGGMKGFRTLYPEYDLLPDEILAEAVRRRYKPDYPKTWDDRFISGADSSGGKVMSSVLPELYIMRGDAYMKAGRREQALADYRRVRSDAWSGGPENWYFDENGNRKYNLPEPFPPPPPEQ